MAHDEVRGGAINEVGASNDEVRGGAMNEVGASKDEVGARNWDAGASNDEAGASEHEAGASDDEVGASDDEVGASEHEVVASDAEGLARFARVVRFGRVTESITLALRGGAITLVTARTPVCDAAAAAGASRAIVSQLRSEMSPNAAVHACAMMSFGSLIVCKD